jgi:hypothetical protein
MTRRERRLLRKKNKHLGRDAYYYKQAEEQATRAPRTSSSSGGDEWGDVDWITQQRALPKGEGRILNASPLRSIEEYVINVLE